MGAVGYPPQRPTGKTATASSSVYRLFWFRLVVTGQSGSTFKMALTRRTTCRSKYVNISRFFNYLVHAACSQNLESESQFRDLRRQKDEEQ